MNYGGECSPPARAPSPARCRLPRQPHPPHQPCPPRRSIKLASTPRAAAASRRRLAGIAPYGLLHGAAWQESRRMRSLFDECTQQALFLAMFARNACFSRSKWQDPRLMRPFAGAIGWFWIHGVKILPGRSPFRVGRSEIIHCAKMLPGLLGLQCGHKKGSPNGDPSNKFFGSAQRLPDAYNLCAKRTSLRFPI